MGQPRRDRRVDMGRAIDGGYVPEGTTEPLQSCQETPPRGSRRDGRSTVHGIRRGFVNGHRRPLPLTRAGPPLTSSTISRHVDRLGGEVTLPPPLPTR